MKILLAIDDSKHSEAAMQMVMRHMRAEDTEICVTHVVEPVWLVLDYETGELGQIEVSREERISRGKEIIERTKQCVMKAGFKVSTALDEGDARLAIVDRAVQWKADLIVLGSHGRKGVGRLLLGSVAESVARHARCSVLIVRTL